MAIRGIEITVGGGYIKLRKSATGSGFHIPQDDWPKLRQEIEDLLDPLLAEKRKLEKEKNEITTQIQILNDRVIGINNRLMSISVRTLPDE